MSDDRIAKLESRIAALESMIVGQGINQDAVYTPAEVAEMIRCCKSNVYNLLESGELAVTRTGAGRKGFKVRGSDIVAFLDSRKEGGPSPARRFPLLGI